MTYNVSPRAIEWLVGFEGRQPRLVAEMCEGGKVEVGWGSTYDLNNKPFKVGQRVTLEQCIAFRAHALSVECAPVWRALRFVPNQNQIDALGLFVFNVGGPSGAQSSVVRLMNEGRWEDAAASFGMWTGATSAGPSQREIDKGFVPKGIRYAQFPDKNGRLVWRWLGPDGEPCDYFRRLRGLLIRHHAEGCISLGLDFREACRDDAIFLRSRREWNSAKKRWQDIVIAQTEFSSVLAVARKYPLQAPAAAPEPVPEPVAPEPAPIPVQEPLVLTEALPELPPTPAPEPVLETAAQIEETPMSTEVKPTSKHPLQSSTIWGIMILAMVPQLEGLAQAFGTMGEQVSGPLSGVFQIVGLWLGIAGRFGASLALAIPGKK